MVFRKHIALAGSLLLLAFSLKAQRDTISKSTSVEDTIIQRIVLIGDAGQLAADRRHPVVESVKKLIKLDKKTTVLYLGDNLYKTGLPDSQALTYRAMKAVLDSQLSVAEGTEAKVIMVPGNHDWHNGSRDGFEAVMREQLYVNFLLKPNVRFLPEDGCPGPVEVSLGDEVTIIAFDSQWWLHPHDKPEIESDCLCKTTDELVTQIEEMATRNSKKLVILANHHPFKSNGTHGGHYPLMQHIFPFTDMKKGLYIPLPLIGSIYPISRSVFGSPQDLKHPIYADMITRITDAVKDVPNIIFAAGHDHNIQHIVDSNRHYIVSGGGAKTKRSSKAKNTRFNSPTMGFGVLEVSRNKNVTLDFYTVSDTSARKEYSAFLLNFSKIPEEKLDTNAIKIDDPFLKYKDTVTVHASDNFPPITGLRKIFMGENYRKLWSVPVNMKVMNLNKQGFKITGLGGSSQTKSLRLVDKKGKEWVLRSLNRDPKPVIPEAFRGNLAKEIVTELNTASHPYGALTFPKLANPLDINVAHPELYFVPDDPALGFYRELFKNNVCMLEEQDASWDGSPTKNTAKVIDKILNENDHRPSTYMILQARLLDFLTADFDRHMDQWRWGTIDTGKGKVYYPIPRDRDQSYFHSDGLVLKFIAQRSMPFLKGFQYNIPKVKWLGHSARDFDRVFLTDLDETEWKEKITDFQERLTDSVIREAVQELPPEIYAIDGETMIAKLISRRKLMAKEAMNYYEFISRRVNVMGSNQKEYFKVNNIGDGLHVRVYARSKGNDTSFIMFDRVFYPKVTREVHLYGLNDEDLFDIEEGTTSKIKLRIIGGRGNDTFDIRGNVENLLYDITGVENNFIRNQSKSKIRFSNDPPVNESSIFGFNYNQTRFPRFHINYNSDDGLIIGTGVTRRTYGFRSLPYATDQKLALLYAVDRKGFQVDYQGIFNHITRKYDLLVNTNISQPALRNFLGWGNRTDKSKNRDFNYYLIRYKTFEIEALLRKRFFENAHLMVGPHYYRYFNKQTFNSNKIIGTPEGLDSVGLDSRIYGRKNYGGMKFAFVVDNRNREFAPTRGIHWVTEFFALKGLTNGSRDLIKYTTDMVIYASLQDPAKLIAILKWGGGRIYTKNYEFFQALSLGANNDLSGFRKTRYNGRALLYGSIELKYKLFDINSFILPGPFGLTGFVDAGRVWHERLSSNTWHSAYGVGIYYLPFNLLAFHATVGISDREKMLIFNMGTKINLIW